MPSINVTCGFCRRRGFVQSASKGAAGRRQLLAALYAQGWTGADDPSGWACSDDCRAWLARDVTPQTKESPALGGALDR